MSSESIIALVAVVTSGVLGVASLGFNFWNSSSERRQRLNERKEDHSEWYRRTLFEKRVTAAQEAYSWWRRLNEAVALASRNEDPNSAENQAVRELAIQARHWYDSSSLCLERPGPSDFVGLTNTALDWAGGARDIGIHKSLNEVFDWVRDLADPLLEPEQGHEWKERHGR